MQSRHIVDRWRSDRPNHLRSWSGTFCDYNERKCECNWVVNPHTTTLLAEVRACSKSVRFWKAKKHNNTYSLIATIYIYSSSSSSSIFFIWLLFFLDPHKLNRVSVWTQDTYINIRCRCNVVQIKSRYNLDMRHILMPGVKSPLRPLRSRLMRSL